MKALIVYESMFGATRIVAEAIAEGLASGPAGGAEVHLVRAADAIGPPGVGEELAGIDLLVVGAPTHARSLPRPSTRRGAPGYVTKPDSGLTLEPGADTAPGVREWLAALPALECGAAAFDTRVDMSPLISGRPSKGIDRTLRRHGATMAAPPESFLVDKRSRLLSAEPDRARAWGARLARTVMPAPFA